MHIILQAKNNFSNMVIGISGKIGSGKDTFSNRFISQYRKQCGLTFKNKKFGYNVKKVVSVLCGVSMRVCLSREGKLVYLPEWGMTIGEMQQKIGTEAIRFNIHPDAWILSLFSTYNDIKDSWIISDVRFKNEADAIRQRGGILIRLNGDPKRCRERDNRDMNHPSETELDTYTEWDYVFDNVPPKSKLDECIQRVICDMIKK